MQLKTQVIILVVLGVILIAGSIIFHLFFGKVFNSMLEKRLMLIPGSKTLENFKAPPVPIFMQFYFLNITNSNEVLQGGTPVLQQIGPYTYEEKQLKYNLSFNDDEGTVTYIQNKSFYYRPDLSPGVDLSDKVTTVNAVMMTLGSKLESQPPSFGVLAEMWFTRFNVQPFVTKSVRELLFDGYEEPLLRQLAGLTKDPEHAKGRFGYYIKNNTAGDKFTVYTGVKGMEDYQSIYRLNGEKMIDYWGPDRYGGNSCNMVNGTSGNQFARPVSRRKLLRLYVGELCRSIFAEYQKDVYHGALTLYRFILPDRLFERTEDTKCFCYDEFTCRPSMINVAPCRKGAPVVISTPHFYQGSQDDVDKVVGLSPVAHEHETYLDIEPNTGVTFRAAKRIQVNMVMKQYGGLPAFRNIPNVVMPIMWVNESAEVPRERTEALHRTLTLPFTLVTVGVAVLATLGVALILVAGIKVYVAKRAGKKTVKTPNGPSRTPKNVKDPSVTEKLNSRNYS